MAGIASSSWRQRFTGLRCTQQHVRCDLSPDGKYLMSGSEDGSVFVWNMDNGEQDLSVGTSRLPQMKGLCVSPPPPPGFPPPPPPPLGISHPSTTPASAPVWGY